ncbi:MULTISPECIES: hypothetical protein [unclassified Methanopyrus]|uniref:hypothetical protein n=1 Tax=unclassified Methanopyrus TaxID=2684913 RepID=UPI0012FACFD6
MSAHWSIPTKITARAEPRAYRTISASVTPYARKIGAPVKYAYKFPGTGIANPYTRTATGARYPNEYS